MTDKKLYIGATMSISNKTCPDASINLNKVGGNFFQIFLTSSKSYGNKRQTKKDLLSLKKNIKKYDQKVVVHGSYMLNYCNPCDSIIHKKAIRLLINDLNESVIIGAIGVVVHMGKNVGKLALSEDEALNNFANGIKKVLSESDKKSTIIFETGAGQGTEICTSMEGLVLLYSKFTDEEKERIKFCIDTCHIFSYGYDIGDEKYVDEYIKLVDKTIGWDNVNCIHLNDSKCKVKCRKDRHADLGEGEVGIEGLKKFIIECYKKDIPIVLETPCDILSCKKQIEMVKKWCK